MRDNHTLFTHENCPNKAVFPFLTHSLTHISFTPISFQSTVKSTLYNIKMPVSIFIQTFLSCKKVKIFETAINMAVFWAIWQ